MGGNGSGGNNRKPVEQHKLEGTYRKDRHGSKPLFYQTATGVISPSKGLSPKAKEHFESLAPLLIERGYLNDLSLKLFERLCETWAEIQEYKALFKKEGMYQRYTEVSVIHPLWRSYRWTNEFYLKMAREFHLIDSDTISPPEEEPMDKAIREAEERRSKTDARG
jgi:phage terminase small subunit